MSRRCVTSSRFLLESLEDRLTPTTLLSPDLSSPAPPRGLEVAVLAIQSNQHGLGLGVFRQLVVIEVNLNTSLLSLGQGSNSSSSLNHQGDTGKTDKDAGQQLSDGEVSNSRILPVVTPSVNSPATPAVLPSIVSRPDQTSSSPSANLRTQPNPSATTNNAAAANAATLAAERAVLLTPAPGGQNNPQTQVPMNPATPVNPVTPTIQVQPIIPTGPAAAPPREELEVPLNGGGNVPSADSAAIDPALLEVPDLPLPPPLEESDLAYPLLPGLIDQLMESVPDVPLPEWLQSATLGHPYWPYALLASSAGIGWLSARKQRRRNSAELDRLEDDVLTDGFPA